MVGQRSSAHFALGRPHILPEAFKTTRLPNPADAFSFPFLSSPQPQTITHIHQNNLR